MKSLHYLKNLTALHERYLEENVTSLLKCYQ